MRPSAFASWVGTTSPGGVDDADEGRTALAPEEALAFLLLDVLAEDEVGAQSVDGKVSEIHFKI